MRGLTTLLSDAKIGQLPRLIPQAVSTLPSCAEALSTSTQNVKNEDTVAAHKFKTQVSTFLQGSAPESRWAGVVLVKCTLELGDREVLQGCGHWARSLLSIFAKPDGSETKTLCIVTLTRLFVLAHEYPTLVREINTPIIPTFITALINLISAKEASQTTARRVDLSSPYLEFVAESFGMLLPYHPTLFRPYASQIHELFKPFVAPTPSSTKDSDAPTMTVPRSLGIDSLKAIRRTDVLLHFCAPKDGAAAEWLSAFEAAISEAHATADQLFRSVVEEWEAGSPEHVSTRDPATFGDPISDIGKSVMGLPPWQGELAGAERLRGLLGLIEGFVRGQTYSRISFPLGVLHDLLCRLLLVTQPDKSGSGVRADPAISKNERELMFLCLPSIHVSVMDLISCLLDRFDQLAKPLIEDVLDIVLPVFATERHDRALRASTYFLFARILKFVGLNLTKSQTKASNPIVRACCSEILPSSEPSGQLNGTSSESSRSSKSASNIDGFLGAKKEKSHLHKASTDSNDLVYHAAWNLLPLFLHHLNSSFVSGAIRDLLDRTAILARHKDAMLASVLNQPPQKPGSKPSSSILPFLASEAGDTIEVEGLLRPRMPLVVTGQDENEQSLSRDEEPETESEAESKTDVTMADEDPPMATDSINGQSINDGTEMAMETRPDTNGAGTDSLSLNAKRSSFEDNQVQDLRSDKRVKLNDQHAKASVQQDESGAQVVEQQVPVVEALSAPAPDQTQAKPLTKPSSALQGPLEDGDKTQPAALSNSSKAIDIDKGTPQEAVVNSTLDPKKYDDDSESEFEIPPLDPTLSDTDEEEEDEE